MINIPIKVAWFCDWNGYEVGFDEVEVVGLYTFKDYNGCHYNMYVDVEHNEILEVWAELEIWEEEE